MTAGESSTAKSVGQAKARYILIGGFLGAGKTTAIGRLAQQLTGQGLRVGLITNDQGRNLVDTAMLRSQGFATEEIPGGCFCCRFDSLVEALQKLAAGLRPQVFVAEPVGSCTDLVATVTYPLRRLYGDEYAVAPVSVLLDPIRAERVLGLTKGGSFSEKVLYIYHKQIEEADLVVIGKCDLVDEGRLDALRQVVKARYPGKEILTVSARNGTNLDEWFARITRTHPGGGTVMDVDYQVYGEGEALLGWLNGTARISAQTPVDAGEFLGHLAREIQQRLNARQAEVAHLKMTLSPDASALGELAVVNLVRNDFVPELSYRLDEPVRSGRLIVNLRAEAAPELLDRTVREGLGATVARFADLTVTVDHLESFRPGQPNPTHGRGERDTEQGTTS